MPSPKVWGTAGWVFLHSIAGAVSETLSEEERKAIVNMMESLSKLLPCKACAKHLELDLKEHPVYPHTETRLMFEKYMYDLHNRVNVNNNKPCVHTFEDVQKAFSPYMWWTGFGDYPFPPDPNYLKSQDKSTEVVKKKSIRNKSKTIAATCFVVLIVVASVTGFSLYKYKKSNKSKK